ncbi:sensor histidine kinase [Hymenobacter cheonanensis]|uniref:sensor histidine kinase n=1 Tax=Hymenobacter sp. CA2-7 TaxID=3063993 RepID=UPI0027143B68|nr:ATP-binding protein [Hymenobacter sp. CA2-7]MDO7885700.1 ATP-binding protein [Hymenobacter sp. CA2-7]
MHLRRQFASLFLLAMLCLAAPALWAQAPAVARLKAALRQPISEVPVADSLLAQARQLGYVPGQIVALSRLASLRLQAQQPGQATPLLQEATQLAGQLTELSEEGWALNEVGAVQRRLARVAPATLRAYDPLVKELGAAMRRNRPTPPEIPSQEGLEVLRELGINPVVPNGPATGAGRRLGRAVPPAPTPRQEAVPQPGTSAFQQYLRAQLAQVIPTDKWLDTLLAAKSSSPQVARRLAASRQARDRSQALSTAAAQQGNYAKALDYFRQYTAYKDSLTAAATANRLATLAYRQNLLRKEAQIQRLTQARLLSEQEAQRQRQAVTKLAISFALLVGLAVVLIRSNRAKQRANQQLNAQKEAVQQALADLKTAQTQLVQAEKMASLGELTAGIAHEIQNPLNFVTNFSEVSTELLAELAEEAARPTRDPELERELLADVQANLQKISQHGQRASSIVKGMLAHSRASTGERQPTDLNALTQEYLQLAYHGARAKDKGFDARLTTYFAPGLPAVPVVPQDISRVLLNVLSNAFYAVHQRQRTAGPGYQPEVQVRTERTASQVNIKIRDNGSGVPEALKQKIFNPFFTTKPTGEGTGLGLSLSYDSITKGHGGTFTLASEEGQFTEVTITLPVGN